MTERNGGPPHVNLQIDGRTITTAKGRMLIDVAEEHGVFVPRFCYHPGMKSVAVCRMCLVKVEGQNKLLPACATPVDEGMNVETQAPDAVGAQRDMLEFLLINHPLDCPICDRAGECPLQDQTYRHGPGSSRYIEPKRTYEKALAISELVVLDRERCVLCWRCVRFSDEIAGDRFIELVDRGAGTQILTFNDEPFDSYFSGNTVQICPVGALTSKPYRFVSRPWNIEAAPSVCAYCSVGCPVSNEARQGDLVRVQALPNEAVNDFWMCDKGRFGYHYVSAQDRLATPLVRGDDDTFEPAGWGRAIEAATKLLDGKSVGVIAGGHLTTEDSHAVAKLARDVLGTRDIDSRIQDAGAPYEAFIDVGGVAGSSASIADLASASTIVWVGPDPKEALPVLYLRLRAAVNEGGAKLVTVSPRALSLDGIASRTVVTSPGEEADAVAALAADLDGKAVVCWGPSAPGRDESAIVAAIVSLARSTGAGVLVCPPHAGSQGAIDMGLLPALGPGYAPVEPGRDTRAILEAAAEGEIETLLLVGADVVGDFPDRSLALRALQRAKAVVVELFPTPTTEHADVILPAAAYAEREGTFTNLERRLQKMEALTAPPGSATEPWQIMQRLAAAAGSSWGWSSWADVWADIRASVPSHASLEPAALTASDELVPEPVYQTGFAPGPDRDAGGVAGPGAYYPKGHRSGTPFQTGQNWPLSWELRAFEARRRPGVVPPRPDGAGSEDPSASGDDGSKHESDNGAGGAEGGLALYAGRMIYGSGTMVARSVSLQRLARRPFAQLSDEDAARLGVAEGDVVVVSGAGIEARVPARVGGIAPGAVFMPYDPPGLDVNALIDGVDPKVEVTKA